MKAVYKEDVTVEKVEFTEQDKKRLLDGEVAFGEGCRIVKDGDDVYYYANRTVNNHSERVEEGSYIVTFSDGSQKLLTPKQAIAQLSIGETL